MTDAAPVVDQKIKFGSVFDAAAVPAVVAFVVIGSAAMPDFDPEPGWPTTVVSILVDPRVRLTRIVAGVLILLFAFAVFAPFLMRQPALRLSPSGVVAWSDFSLRELSWDEIESIGPKRSRLLWYAYRPLQSRHGTKLRVYEDYLGETEFKELPETINDYLWRLGRPKLPVLEKETSTSTDDAT